MGGITWTADLVATDIRDVASAVKAETDRVERETKELAPTCSTHRYQYTTAADLAALERLVASGVFCNRLRYFT